MQSLFIQNYEYLKEYNFYNLFEVELSRNLKSDLVIFKKEIVKYSGKQKHYLVKPKYELIGSHTGMRTFITNSILAGVPLSVIQKITGHKKLTTLQAYVSISEEVGAYKMQLLSNYFK